MKLANTINEEDEINEANAAHKSGTARSSNNLDNTFLLASVATEDGEEIDRKESMALPGAGLYADLGPKVS